MYDLQAIEVAAKEMLIELSKALHIDTGSHTLPTLPGDGLEAIHVLHHAPRILRPHASDIPLASIEREMQQRRSYHRAVATYTLQRRFDKAPVWIPFTTMRGSNDSSPRLSISAV